MEIIVIGVLAVLVIGAVALPLFRDAGHGHAADAQEFAVAAPAAPPPPTQPATTAAAAAEPAVVTAGASADAVEAEIARYREATLAGTLCRRCGEANPPGARFCRDCGKPLPANDAQEFAT